jgi:hypothetical protein
MKVRLQISTRSSSYAFEHRGPILRIGRDTQSDLSFTGDAGQTVSWNHARIVLTPRGATLSDLGSSNGTFLNDQRIADRVAIHEGDGIRLGQTGPLLQIVELDLTDRAAAAPGAPAHPGGATDTWAPPTAPAAPPLPAVRPVSAPRESPAAALPQDATARALQEVMQRSRMTMLIGIGIAAMSVVIVGALVVGVLTRPKEPTVAQASQPTEPASHRRPEATTQKPEPISDPAKEKPPAEGTAAPPAAVPADAIGDAKPVGRYVASDKAPSILLQRSNDLAPWVGLRPDDRVETGSYLMSLPGYRSNIYLDSGVHLGLWGNVPEFATFPPVLESTAMLHAPSAGVDLDFTLDHGRVHLGNYKQKATAQVRVRLPGGAVWDLTLPNNDAEMVLELWSEYPLDVPFSLDPAGPGPVAHLGLFVKGQGQLHIGDQNYPLKNLTRLAWSAGQAAPVGPVTLAKLPDWWTEKPASKDWHVAEVMLVLSDFATKLKNKDNLVDATVTEIQESDPDAYKKRALGALFLGAMDAVPPLVDFLKDRRYPQLRGTAAFTLRHWRSRRKEHDSQLLRALQEKTAKDKAEIILRLLHGFSTREIEQPETYQTLLAYLDHENLEIRELALYHLAFLVPEGAKKIFFDAAAEPEKRKPALDAWKKLLLPGKVPVRPVPRAGGK